MRVVWLILFALRMTADPRKIFPNSVAIARLSSAASPNLVSALSWGRWRALRVRLLWLTLWALSGVAAVLVYFGSAVSPSDLVRLLGTALALVLFYGTEIAVMVLREEVCEESQLYARSACFWERLMALRGGGGSRASWTRRLHVWKPWQPRWGAFTRV
jgi:uncharacterized membrane protein YfcA